MILARAKSSIPGNCWEIVYIDLFQSYAISLTVSHWPKFPRSLHIFELHILLIEMAHPLNESQIIHYLEGKRFLEIPSDEVVNPLLLSFKIASMLMAITVLT